MTSVIFVHGTGGRKTAYATTFEQIESELSSRRPDVKLFPCLWGDELGAQLQAKGASIPTFSVSQPGPPTEAEKEIALWDFLYRDPMYELRLLSVRPQAGKKGPPGQQTPAQEIRTRLTEASRSSTLTAQLDRLLIGAVFEQACQDVMASSAFSRLIQTASRPLEGDYGAIARAVVSKCRLLCKANDIYPMLLVNVELRSQAVDVIKESLTQGETTRGGLATWAKEQMGEALKDVGGAVIGGLGNALMDRKRGAVMNATYPAAGDILVYQAQGQKIRDFIQSQVESVDGPVVLMAHSLGGIACVDLLVAQDLSDKVTGLITAGSQAPFLYEIGALQTLSYGQPLPDHFPKQWLNLYDLRDFLSYIGNQPGLFPGQIKDVQVDNQQPFPESHSAYWANPNVWTEIVKVLP